MLGASPRPEEIRMSLTDPPPDTLEFDDPKPARLGKSSERFNHEP